MQISRFENETRTNNFLRIYLFQYQLIAYQMYQRSIIKPHKVSIKPQQMTLLLLLLFFFFQKKIRLDITCESSA